MSSIKFKRKMGLGIITATGICSMMGASINVVPFMIQKNVPGIGTYVIPAFIFAAIPALLAALSYSILASAMPRAGGSYLYASRGLNPYLGFAASFSQWFGLSVVIGVIAYIIPPFLRDISILLNIDSLSLLLENGTVRLIIALLLIWLFVIINIRGTSAYTIAIIPMLYLMFILGGIVIFTGYYYDSSDFIESLKLRENITFTPVNKPNFELTIFFSAAAVLFSSFIGFDSIAQTGSEAKSPTKSIPKAILLSICSVGLFYFLFTSAVYNVIPWSFIAEESLKKDISAPGMLSYILPPGWAVAILIGAAFALINDLPSMILSVSRLMYSWSKDNIFPNFFSEIHPNYNSPFRALIFSGCLASLGAFGSHFASDIFLGIDIMVTSMMFNFMLMCLTLITIPRVNPSLYNRITLVKNRLIQKIIGYSGLLLLIFFFVIHTYKDISMTTKSWYFHSTYIWLIVMSLATLFFIYRWKFLILKNKNLREVFKKLPDQ